MARGIDDPQGELTPMTEGVTTVTPESIVDAQDLEGKAFSDIQSGYIARIWQHEFDHLQGILITDRMGLADRLKHRRVLKELEENYNKKGKGKE